MLTETREQLERAWKDCVDATEQAGKKRYITIADDGEGHYRLSVGFARTVYRSDGVLTEDWASNVLYALQQQGWLDATADEIDLFLHQKGV